MIEPYDWQRPRVNRLSDILSKHPAALDASATGTGKTVVALAVAKALQLKPLVIAPKSVLSAWRETAEAMGISVHDVANLEKLKTGKTPWLIKVDAKKFKWALPAASVILLDECHRVSGADTLNARAIAMAKVQGIKVLCLSATPYQSPLQMRALGWLLGLHSYDMGSYWSFCRKYGCRPNPFHRGLVFPVGASGQKYLKQLHALLAPMTVRTTIDSVPGFPENSVQCELFDLAADHLEEIRAIEAEFSAALKASPASAVEKQLRMRQCTELRKVPLLAELASDAIAEGNSPIVFLTFRESVDILHRELSKKHSVAKIIGGQTQAERDLAVQRFQTDQSVACVATIASGGQGISLHHVETSTRPRRTFITPNFAAVDLVQALGRAHRAGGLSKVIQLIVLAAGTVEEHVYKAVQRKLKQIETLIDGDLSGI